MSNEQRSIPIHVSLEITSADGNNRSDANFLLLKPGIGMPLSQALAEGQELSHERHAGWINTGGLHPN